MPHYRFRLLMGALVGLFIAALGSAAAQPAASAGPASPNAGPAHTPLDSVRMIAQRAPSALSPAGQALALEREPNNTAATATLLSSGGVLEGSINPTADIDFFTFRADAGDRIYAATMTSFSPDDTSDSMIELRGPNGVTVLEMDEDDGTFGGLASSIAGTLIPTTGMYFLRVVHSTSSDQIRPYRLYLQVQRGSPQVEVEPNDTTGTAQPLSNAGWVAGSIAVAGDVDRYALTLTAGESVFLSLDADPERDASTWNPRLGLGNFNSTTLLVNDANTVSPNSEAFFLTVKASGTYFIYVNAATNTGAATFTYQLSATVVPAASQATCTTYTSTDLPKALGAEPGLTVSTLTIPGTPRISDLKVSLALTHTSMPDLDVSLTAPPAAGGNTVGLFSDIGSPAQSVMDLTLDDAAALPVGLHAAVSGMIAQPEASYRLGWFDGQNAGGTWTLTLYDDAALNGGRLLSWSLTVCSDPPPTVCPAGSSLTPVYSSNFEATDGGFTSSGAANEWEWGTPSYAPISTSNSGTKAWVTDLDNTYNANADQNLLSPAINLSTYSGPIYVAWAQKYQIENASYDRAFVEARQVGGATPQRLWEWAGATMTDGFGNPTVEIQESAGWGMHYADLSGFAGQQLQLRFHLDSESSLNLGGLAIDDVTVSACVLEPTSTPVTPTATPVTPSATPITPTAVTPTATAVTPTPVTPTATSLTPTPVTPSATPITPTPMTPSATPVTPSATPITPTPVTPSATPPTGSPTPTPVTPSATATTTATATVTTT
ncbi:MAG: peptidase, partial [Herpetosiphonaceae bacterium]|nr:peptidase [Herpetosiphonaceae bacterium]